MKTIQIPEDCLPMVRAMLKKELKAANELVNDKRFVAEYPALTREAKRGVEWMTSVLEELSK